MTDERLIVAIERLAGALETPQRLCVDAAGLGELLDVSERHVRRLDDRGAIPAAIELGESKRWCIDEIQRWLAEGGPSRREWENLRNDLAGSRDVEAGRTTRRR